MASEKWRVNRDAIERRLHDLGARARRIPFVTLVEHLERLVVGSVPVGARGPVADEIVRFSHDPSLVFHSSDIASMRVEGTRVALTTTFLGATGAVSPLASFFTEDVLHADSQDQNTLAAFYDVFHHRLLSLLYRALQRTRPSWGSGVGGGALQGRALAAIGLATPRKDSPLASLAMLGRARVLTRRARGTSALQVALGLAFPDLVVRVVDFLPRRVRLGEDQRLRLGVANHRLGTSTRLGRHVTSQSDLLRLEMGPLDRDTLARFMPGGESFDRLRRVVDAVTGGLVEIEAELEVARGEEPRACLGRTRPQASGASLGRTSLLVQSRSPRVVRVRVRVSLDDAPRPVFFQGPREPRGELANLVEPAPESARPSDADLPALARGGRVSSPSPPSPPSHVAASVRRDLVLDLDDATTVHPRGAVASTSRLPRPLPPPRRR